MSSQFKAKRLNYRLRLLSHHMNTQMTNYLVLGLGSTHSEQKFSTFTYSCRLGSFRSFV